MLFGVIALREFVLDSNPGDRDRGAIPATGGSFERKPLPDGEVPEVRWDPPTSQSEDGRWVYDLFTPPKIYIDPETNLFSVIPYTGPRGEAPFGIDLVRVERPLYRFRFEGFIEEDPQDAGRSLIRLYNRETERLELVRVGDERGEGDFRVVDFRLQREIGESGLLETKAELEIEDLRLNERVVMELGETRYADTFRLVFSGRDTEGMEQTYTVETEGESFEHDKALYTVQAIDFGKGTVRVEKEESDPDAPRTSIQVFFFETQTAQRAAHPRLKIGTTQKRTCT